MHHTLTAHNLVKCFGAVRGLDKVSLLVSPGEIVGLLGPNGAGKTTALRILGQLLNSQAERTKKLRDMKCPMDISWPDLNS